LELFAFVRPAKFCAPSAAGLPPALGLPEPKGAPAQAEALGEARPRLLGELAAPPQPSREEAPAGGQTPRRRGRARGAGAIAALRWEPVGNMFRASGLDVWTRLTEWEAEAPAGEAGSRPIASDAAAERLQSLLQRAGLAEPRPAQAEFAAEAAFAFQPRE